MRSYTVAAAALSLGMSPKWLDNALSHHQVDGVVRVRQGVSRRLSQRSLLTLYLAVTLVTDLGTPLKKALQLAKSLSESDGPGGVVLPHGLRLTIDIDDARRQLAADLAKAVEAAPVPKRGRRPVRK